MSGSYIKLPGNRELRGIRADLFVAACLVVIFVSGLLVGLAI